MPRRKKSDLSSDLAPVFSDFEKKIARAVEKYIAEQIGMIHEAFADAVPGTKAKRGRKVTRKKPGRKKVGRKKAARKKVGRKKAARKKVGRKKAAKKKTGKGGRVKLAVVKDAVLRVLQAQSKPVGMNVLRTKVPYNDAQIRRALDELIASRHAAKSGSRRDMTYRATGKKAPKKKTTKKKAAKKKVGRKKAAKKKAGRKKAAKKKVGRKKAAKKKAGRKKAAKKKATKRKTSKKTAARKTTRSKAAPATP